MILILVGIVTMVGGLRLFGRVERLHQDAQLRVAHVHPADRAAAPGAAEDAEDLRYQ